MDKRARDWSSSTSLPGRKITTLLSVKAADRPLFLGWQTHLFTLIFGLRKEVSS